MFWVIVNAHSERLKVYPVRATTSYNAIKDLTDCFTRYELSITLVSDNSLQFTSKEFQKFINISCGIKFKT